MKVEELIEALTLEEKISLLSETAPEIERLGIRRYHHGNEALHGVVRPGKFTVFPQAIGMGASFHPQLLQQVATAISDEARARHNAYKGEMQGGDFDGLYNGLLTFWSPNLNTARDPRWGRTGETYGEDPYLIGLCGIAFIKGLQGEQKDCLKTVATPKHFTGNNEEHNRFECNAVIPRKQYFDYYLKPFEMAVKEGKCESIMASYNAVDGVPCHANSELLTNILRKRWGFTGYVVSDCGAVSHLVDRHKFAASPQAAAAQALKAGVDLECGSCGTIQQVYKNYLKLAQEQGLISESDIDKAVTRVLCAREKLGILGEPNSAYDYLTEDVIGCAEHQELALRMAEESLVLLKNDKVDGSKVLPIKEDRTICVIGPQADVIQFGDYSGQPVHEPITILKGLEEQFSKEKIKFVPYEAHRQTKLYHTVDANCLWHDKNKERKPGLNGSYHSLKDAGAWGSRVDERIDFEWENTAPDPLIQRAHFDIFWEGYLIPKRSGIYEFAVKVNEKECSCKARYHLEIDEKPAHLDSFELEEGREYKVTLKYLNNGEQPSVKLLWKYVTTDPEENYKKEVMAASQYDLVIACLGLGTEYEAEGRDKTDLNIPIEQMELLKTVYRVNHNLIVTLYNGSSLTIPWIQEHAKGILECWYPGEQGGRAIGRVMSGKVNPSGRLPLTFYQDVEDLPSFDCYDIRQGLTSWYAKKVQYPFGYGLSYSQFEYSDLTIREGESDLQGLVTVQNTGEMAGYEVIQIYMCYVGKEYEPEKLSWTEKIWIEQGKMQIVEFRIPCTVLADYDEETDRDIMRIGKYRIIVARDARTPILSKVVERGINKWKK